MESHDAVRSGQGADSSGVVWHLNDALFLVKDLQPTTRAFGYHLALGGGVLNRGFSTKDLDLYFLPMNNEDTPANSTGMLTELVCHFGQDESIGGVDYDKDERCIKVKFANNGKRIDAFIWK